MEDWYGRKFKIIEERATFEEQEERLEQMTGSDVQSTKRRSRPIRIISIYVWVVALRANRHLEQALS